MRDAHPLGAQILSISCSFWENMAKSYVGTPPEELAPPPQGNPGSATVIPSGISIVYFLQGLWPFRK